MAVYDVLVIGAGLAGLSAAREVREAGKTVLVLEARDRVGGKMYTVTTDSGGRLDLGGAWLNEHSQPLIAKLARESGIRLVKQSVVGKASLELGPGYKVEYRDVGRLDETEVPFESADAESHEKVERLLVSMCPDRTTLPDTSELDPRIKQYDNITIGAWLDLPEVAATSRVKGAVMTDIHAIFGVEMEELRLSSLLYCAATCGGWLAMISMNDSGAQYQRMRDDTQGVSQYLASLLPPDAVKLGSPVGSVAQSFDFGQRNISHVTVTTRAGKQYNGAQVVCTIPSPLCSNIVWSPPLPVAQQALIQRVFTGVQGKCVVVYPRPWWIEAGYSGTHQLSEGPITGLFDTSDGDVDVLPGSISNTVADSRIAARQYSLTGFIAGQRALDFFSLDKTDGQRSKEALDQISRLFNDDPSARQPSEIYYLDWTAEEFSQGAPCPILAVGALSNYGQYYGRRHERVWFAGSEYSEIWQGYMEGAVHSGREVG